MCEYDDISRLDSYVHTVYDMLNDDERSRLDFMRDLVGNLEQKSR